MYSDDGETCMMLAAVSQSLPLLELLVERGANVNAVAKGEEVSTI